MVKKDPSHSLGGGVKEVRAVVPVRDFMAPGQPEPGLVNEIRNVERMARAFAAQVLPGDLLELAVDALEQCIGCSFLLFGNLTEQTGDMVRPLITTYRNGRWIKGLSASVIDVVAPEVAAVKNAQGIRKIGVRCTHSLEISILAPFPTLKVLFIDPPSASFGVVLAGRHCQFFVCVPLRIA
jgi:hypothetical protein